jgi:hypothetical protein
VTADGGFAGGDFGVVGTAAGGDFGVVGTAAAAISPAMDIAAVASASPSAAEGGAVPTGEAGERPVCSATAAVNIARL